MLIRGECISACAYLKDKGIKVDLSILTHRLPAVRITPRKFIYEKIRKSLKPIAKAEEELELEELRAFEEKMYGDIWNKEDYLNWMYET